MIKKLSNNVDIKSLEPLERGEIVSDFGNLPWEKGEKGGACIKKMNADILYGQPLMSMSWKFRQIR